MVVRTEITEDFIRSLRGVFTEHYIEVPEDKYDILGDMEKEIEEPKVNLMNRLMFLFLSNQRKSL